MAKRIPKWGMVIDLDRCTGCQACGVACHAENNLALNTEDIVLQSRAKNWIRLERYWEGDFPEVKARFLPIPCQQCDNAPCEPVCPVFATHHNVAMLWLRHAGGLRQYLGVDQFWGMAKILLALSLLWFYFWWSEFITMWYGRTPAEQAVLDQLTFGPYLLPFVLTFALCFAVPLLALMWNRVRQSIWGPGLVAAGVLVGLFLDRMRLYGAAFATGGGPQLPTGADLLIMGGALAAVGFLYLLASRVVPLISLWEVKEGLLLRRERLRWGAPRTIIVKPE